MWKFPYTLSLSLTTTRRIVGFKRITLWNLFILSNCYAKWLCWVMILLVSQLGSKNTTCSQCHQLVTFPFQTLLVAVIWITQRNKFIYPQGLLKDPKHFFILFRHKIFVNGYPANSNSLRFWDKLQEKISWNVHYVVNEEVVSLSCNWCLWMVASQRPLFHSACPWPTAIHESLQNHISFLLTYFEINLILAESNSTEESGSNSHTC